MDPLAGFIIPSESGYGGHSVEIMIAQIFTLGKVARVSVKFGGGHLHSRIGLGVALRRSLLLARPRPRLLSCPRLVLVKRIWLMALVVRWWAVPSRWERILQVLFTPQKMSQQVV